MAKSRRQASTKTGTIYFIQSPATGLIKIGWTERDPEKRISDFSTGSPEEFERLGTMPGTREEEGGLHSLFKDSWVKGEWFRPNREIFEFVRRTCSMWSPPPKSKPKREPSPERPPSPMASRVPPTDSSSTNASYKAFGEQRAKWEADLIRRQLQAPGRKDRLPYDF